jgi:hypothetical protein
LRAESPRQRKLPRIPNLQGTIFDNQILCQPQGRFVGLARRMASARGPNPTGHTRLVLFEKPADYPLFEEILAEPASVSV